MLWTGFKRIARAGFTGFWRNAFISVTSVLVMAVTLFVIASSLFNTYALNRALDDLQERVDINVYMVTTASEEAILEFKETLETLPDVREVNYISREQALVNFREKHQNDELTIRALEELGDNPLGASLTIRAQETSQYESIAALIEQKRAEENPESPLIDRVNYAQNKGAIEQLNEIITEQRETNNVKTIALALLAVFVSFNMIRLVIHSSREEISVMRLVGASNFFISSPFIVGGILQGVFAAVLVLLTLYPILIYNESLFYPFPFFSDLDGGKLLFNYFVTDFGKIFLIIMGSSVGIGAVASLLAVQRYLKV